jgi:hypothetical protein
MLGRQKKKQKQKSENENVDRNSNDFLSTFFIKGKGLKDLTPYILYVRSQEKFNRQIFES